MTKPAKKPSRSSPRPEELGADSTSPQTPVLHPLVLPCPAVRPPLSAEERAALQVPPFGPLTPFGQRKLIWFHHPDNYHVMALCWTDFETRQSGPGGKPVKTLKCYNLLHTAENGGVVHSTAKPGDEKHFKPTGAMNTIEQFETYLKGRLLQFGGVKTAYKFLGVAPPSVEHAPASDEAAETLDSLYTRCASVLDTTVDVLKGKYGKLNVGLQSMNLRNRMRAKGANV